MTNLKKIAAEVKAAKTDRNARIKNGTVGEGGAEPRTDGQIKAAVDGKKE